MKNNYYPKTYGRKRGKRKSYEVFNYKRDIDNYLFNFKIVNNSLILDIGSGNGENSINLSKKYFNQLVIACEVYVDGNISLIKKIKKNNSNNIKIYDKNCYILLNNISRLSVDQVWILYPDPWPKKKHHKRKLISESFLNILNCVLKNNGKIYIDTDNQNYFTDILNNFYNNGSFKWENDRSYYWARPFQNMPHTSYFMKSQKKGTKSYFLIFQKKI